MTVTMADIARLANVSKTTVSRVLNGRPDVDSTTAERIRRIVSETNYSRSARAVGLAKGQAHAVGMMVPSLTWPWMADVLQGAADVLEEHGYGLLLHTSERGEQSLVRFTEQVASRSFDGLLVIEPPNTIDFIADLHSRGLPVVLIDDRAMHPGFPSVATTNRLGGEQAAEHLLQSGRRQLALIAGPSEYGCTRQRSAGYLETAREHGTRVTKRAMVESDFTEQGGFDAMTTLLDLAPRTEAVFAQNDLMAVGALRALRSSGRRVPDDVAVVGFDDIPLAAHTTPALTTVRQPSYEMAAAAARALLDRVGGSPEVNAMTLPTTLSVRESAPASQTTTP
ncbi:LacI family DNA-binding transcriptional regulator [Jatrophihabitans sp. YIM 134969]